MDWVRKHSPLKSRNKPLPKTPADGSPSRDPIKQISGNVSPSKSRLNRSSIYERPPEEKVLYSSNERNNGTGIEKHSSEPLHSTRPKRVIRLRKSSREKPTAEVHDLTQRVSSLEAQLEEARRELRTIVGSTIVGSTQEKQRVRSVDVSSGREGRQVASGKRVKSDGYSEEKVKASTYTQVHVKSTGPASSKQNPAIKSVQQGQSSDFDQQQLSDLQHKRKRSEVRQASWEQIQSHISGIQQKQEPGSKRQKQSSGLKQPRFDKQLPPSPYDGSEPVLIAQKDHGYLREEKEAIAEQQPMRKLDFAPGKPCKADGSKAASKPKASTDRTDESSDQGASLATQSTRDTDQIVSNIESEANEVDQKDKFKHEIYISRPPSPSRRFVPSPSRLDPVREVFEWDDEEIF